MSDDSFFSRWSRRKTQVRIGEMPDEPLQVASSDAAPVQPDVAVPDAAARSTPARPPSTQSQPGVPADPETLPPPPTLEDVARLTTESDYSPFVARNVPSEVRNAAVRKLFADPHFNVMDGLDIYIDDYSKPSPLAAADMARMVGAQFLKLVDDPGQSPSDPPHPIQAAPAEAAEERQKQPPDPDVLQARPEETHDDHADLQLQPDDAPGPQGPGSGTG